MPLAIRPAQMEAFRARALFRFENEMVDHSRGFNPQLCATLGEDQLRIAVRKQIIAADRYGFSSRGPMRLCVELMFLFGSRFGDDPQYPRLGEILRADHGEMSRAQDLHEWANDYLDFVSGPDNAHVRRALLNLPSLASGPFNPTNDLAVEIADGLMRVYPEKYFYLGRDAVGRLIQEGLREARQCGFVEPRHQALVVVLMFAFGHGCLDEPLYPWISRVLRDASIVDALTRAQRLERKAATWLRHVLAAEPERSP